MKTRKAASSKAGKKKAGWASQLVEDLWPLERDFFERPDRYRYVRKLLPSEGCVFCKAKAASDLADSLVLYRDAQVLVLMNKYPYNTGHLLILPADHVGSLDQVDDKTVAAMGLWIKKSVSILTEVLACQGFNIGLNHGAVAGAGIPDHIHWHVVPRWAGDTNFFPLIAQTKVLPETLEQTYSRLREHFSSAKVKSK